jgi:hypothetical protein
LKGESKKAFEVNQSGRTTANVAAEEAQIRALMEDRVEAVRAKDIDRCVLALR